MKTSRIIWIALSIVSITSLVAADGLLGDKRGGSGGSSGSGNGGSRGGSGGGSGGGDRGGSGGGSDRGGSGGGNRGGSGGGGGDRGGNGGSGGSGSGGTRVPSGGSSGGSGGSRGGSGGGSDRGGSGGGSDRGGDGGSTRVPSGGSRSGNGGSGGPPGRPDNGGNGGSTRVDSRSSNTGRSGRVEYRTQNNMNRGGRPTDSVRIDSVPDFRPGIGGQSRDERSLPGNSRYRTGYYQYNNTWCDDNFWYPHYQFNYNSRNCVVSPWYYYSNLPGYIDSNRVRFDLRCANIGVTVTWNWNSGDRYDRYSNDYYLNNSINDLNAVFSRRDMRALDRLVPQNDYVYIHSDGGRDYSIRADDYFDMMRDLVTSTRTRVFSIQRVETSRGYAEVFAKHVFQDAWGYESSVYLTFILEQDRRGGYTISEFSSSNRCDY